mmetsp:Transcript_12403/g.16106  ORF Transcript_12403/g.16106 Transcript_12403/m.16106 type:complete len:283 (+) Transcript_12403:169-1017(+)|eukprot:CAMPEP_0204866280 /NCGR_PEP_ID=MMETSP1348-20121228/16778_1 /ASSEMBLY_ACC=CAM_ASM_000700 /TAXON_ID=215587 /ORGANISM="Aplanochytrium stocchinoi, Strain GSBS06" /LENGTH=282 /DNA_ID=CAMNT_0052018101 /DNA_START=74 /DNA_END=922 /DNA_ORIENTATION=+
MSDFNALRGSDINGLFFESESLALEDWKETLEILSEEEKKALEPDIVLRTVRGSHFLKDRRKRVARNAGLLQGRVAWYKENDVGNALFNKPLSNTDMFRQKVLPIKIYGKNPQGHPILKFSLKDTDWYLAKKEIPEDHLLKLVIRTLESMSRSVTEAGCHGECTEPKVHVQGKYIAVFDLDGLSWTKFRSANSLGLKNLMATCAKFYPETVLKTYVLNSYIVKAVITVLSPFIPLDTRERISVCTDVKQFVNQAQEKDNISLDQLPVEFGGSCEGEFVMKID